MLKRCKYGDPRVKMTSWTVQMLWEWVRYCLLVELGPPTWLKPWVEPVQPFFLCWSDFSFRLLAGCKPRVQLVQSIQSIFVMHFAFVIINIIINIIITINFFIFL